MVENQNEGQAETLAADESSDAHLHKYSEAIIDLDGDVPSLSADTDDDNAGDVDENDGADGENGNGADGDGTDDEGNSDDEGRDDGEGDKDAGEKDGKPGKRSGVSRLKARIAALEEKLAAADAAPAVNVDDKAALRAEVVKRIGEAPKESDFADYLEFERESAAYVLDRRQAERQIKAEVANASTVKTEAAGEKTEILVETHRSRLDELEKVAPGSKAAIKDLRKTMEAAGHKAEMAPHVGELMLESEKSALLALHFTKNPGKLAELNGMSERAATREITRLEGRLSQPKPRTATSAPPPPDPVRGSTAPAFNPAKASMSSYAANWAAARKKG